MMTQINDFAYLYSDDLEILRMAYRGDEFSMVIVLPSQPDGLVELEENLIGEQFSSYLTQLRQVKMEVILPRFTIDEPALGLVDSFQALGVERLFVEQAELQKILDSDRLKVSDIFHKAFVKVEGKGTEAAAPTGAVVVAESMPMTFHANRGFLFFIVDDHSDAFLFMGRIADPY